MPWFHCPGGASGEPASIGGLLLANLLASGFTGPVYPVNPRHQVIQGVTAYPDLARCPEPPDLAVVAVPAPLVAGVIDEAGRLGVRAVCVISAGFAEVGGDGRALQDELCRRARVAGVRLIGPNCTGLLNGGPDPRFNATFSLNFPPPGRLAFVTQSGGLGLAALTLLTGPSLGVSGFVSVGNTADLTPNDLLLYWDEDPATSLILAYLESVPDPRRFARAARRISRHKPMVVVKAGRTSAGRRAASSHTAAMAAGEVAVEALAVKIAAATHKSDVGGVALGIDSPRAAANAVTAIRATLAQAGIAEHAGDFLVQEQIGDGVEMIVGVSHDPAFGPLVLAGLGGTTVEVVGDVAVRITPLSNADVDEMLRSLHSYRLLTGCRQAPPLDVAAFAELLHRVSNMVEDIPEITELDLNPVFVRQHGAVAADVRIRLTG